MSFKDHFSAHAAAYSAHRPTYPADLFSWLSEQAPQQQLAWDCATGSGQAAIALAEHFEQVAASDASSAQIDNAERHSGIEYRVAPAESSGLADGSVALITVAQALHWFDHAAFNREVERVLQPGGLLACWGYGNQSAGADVDPLLQHYYTEIVGPYWPPERRHVENAYRDLPFPFSTLDTPAFAMCARWSRGQLMAYLNTWSATQRYSAAGHADPLPALEAQLAEHWTDDELREIRWPLFLRLGRKP